MSLPELTGDVKRASRLVVRGQLPGSGLEVELELGQDPVDVVVADRPTGLPTVAQAVAAARRRSARGRR